jgi:hypothetical protein
MGIKTDMGAQGYSLNWFTVFGVDDTETQFVRQLRWQDRHDMLLFVIDRKKSD